MCPCNETSMYVLFASKAVRKSQQANLGVCMHGFDERGLNAFDIKDLSFQPHRYAAFSFKFFTSKLVIKQEHNNTDNMNKAKEI